MAYIVSPDPSDPLFMIGGIGVPVLSPPQALWPFFITGLPQISIVCPLPIVWPLIRGEKITTQFQTTVHGVPGTTSPDDVFPDQFKPQYRLSPLVVPPAVPIVYVVQLFHGVPGTATGDDNWELNPIYQPQLRGHSVPHQTIPPSGTGSWKVNEAFLGSDG